MKLYLWRTWHRAWHMTKTQHIDACIPSYQIERRAGLSPLFYFTLSLMHERLTYAYCVKWKQEAVNWTQQWLSHLSRAGESCLSTKHQSGPGLLPSSGPCISWRPLCHYCKWPQNWKDLFSGYLIEQCIWAKFLWAVEPSYQTVLRWNWKVLDGNSKLLGRAQCQVYAHKLACALHWHPSLWATVLF